MSYQNLKSYQNATVVYDFTVEFCNRYVLPPHDKTSMTYTSNRSYRMADQMVQAARSGKQNIVEGSSERASSKGEIKLLGVARASLQELLEDYLDFLRQKNLPLWPKESAKAQEVRALAYTTYMTYKTYKSYIASPEGACNAMVCLINQTNFLLDRQLKALEQRFIKQGGYSERLFKKRLEERKRKAGSWGF